MKNYINLFKTSYIAGALALISFSQVAQAARCDGPVTALGVTTDGGAVSVSLGGLDHTVLCALNHTYLGIPADVCKAVYAYLLSAKTTGKPVSLRFTDPGTSCTDRNIFPAWGIPKEPFRLSFYE